MQKPPPKKALNPNQSFHFPGRIASAFTVVDFWRWAFSDLQDNTNRGVLAEYIVARALAIEPVLREGWANYDLLTPEGIRIEVKASGLLQSWAQKGLSEPSFSGLKGLAWEPVIGYDKDQSYRADVYVFAVQIAKDPASYDSLDLSQWEFCVLPRKVLEALNQKTISYSAVKKHSPGAVDYHGLREAVLQAVKSVE